MSKRVYRTNGKIPSNLYELSHVTGDGTNLDIILTPSSTLVGLEIARKPWYSFLSSNSLLWKHIETNYKYRPFIDEITRQYIPPFDYSDFADLESYITNKSCSIYWKNMYKYDKLWEALTVEFNPLWNVDGVEETVRTLEKDGSIRNSKDGYDEVANTGHDDVTHGGKDTTTKTGNAELVKSGYFDVNRLGDDDTTYSGKETNNRNGDRQLTTQGGETTTHKEATTDSQTMLGISEDYTTYGVQGESGTLANSKMENETFTNLKDEKTFTDRQDSVHHDVTDTTTYHDVKDKTTYNNVKDEVGYGHTTKTEYLSKHKTSYDIDDVQTFDTVDTERTKYERHGNIGVTTTTQLLSEYVEYAKLIDFVDIVAKDILEVITVGVY